MVENEGEKLFLVKNLFSLKKVNGKILFSNDKIMDLEIYKNSFWTTSNRLVFVTEITEIVAFYKKSEYQDVQKNRYRIHHKCFNDLQEWLKKDFCFGRCILWLCQGADCLYVRCKRKCKIQN